MRNVYTQLMPTKARLYWYTRSTAPRVAFEVEDGVSGGVWEIALVVCAALTTEVDGGD